MIYQEVRENGEEFKMPACHYKSSCNYVRFILLSFGLSYIHKWYYFIGKTGLEFWNLFIAIKGYKIKSFRV